MEKKCVVCHSRTAEVRCFHCHKPLCGVCAFRVAGGSFCSQQCAGAYVSFKSLSGRRKARRPSRLVSAVLALLIIAALAFLAWKLGWIPRLGKP